MKVKLISVGDEILIGQIVNTNASYLGEKFLSYGMPVAKVVVIGDNEEDLLNEFGDSLKNFDITIITGGLGPTHDDITKPALVKFFDDELILNEDILRRVKDFFSSRNLNMPESNIEQAMMPSLAKEIRNDNGTAPGIWIEKEGKVFVALPGVPYEMKAMITESVIPELLKLFKGKLNKTFRQKTLLTTGIGESALFEKLGDISLITAYGKLAFLPSAVGVRVRINSQGNDEEDAQSKLSEMEKLIMNNASEYVYGEGDETLEEVVGRLLRDKGKNLSVAESCTGGTISSKIVSVPGSSDYYKGGVCAYANEEKIRLLNVREESLAMHGAVSSEVAIEMAVGARSMFGTDFAISTTGIAGPSGATHTKPVGLVFIGYSDEERSFAAEFNFGNRRDVNILRASVRALDILRKELLKL